MGVMVMICQMRSWFLIDPSRSKTRTVFQPSYDVDEHAFSVPGEISVKLGKFIPLIYIFVSADPLIPSTWRPHIFGRTSCTLVSMMSIALNNLVEDLILKFKLLEGFVSHSRGWKLECVLSKHHPYFVRWSTACQRAAYAKTLAPSC